MRDHRARQERWLHARISEDLDEALKREARRRRTPVSLLVRNVLEGALDLVEDIVQDSLEVARRSRRLARNAARGRPSASETGADSGADPTGRDTPGPSDEAEVYGWQELILNRAARCARCADRLAAGATAHRGLREEPGRPVFLCSDCVGRLKKGKEKGMSAT